MDQINLLTPTSEIIMKKIVDIMTKRHYPSYSVMCLFKDLKQYDQTEICKALAFLCQNKLLKIDDSLGDHVTLKSFSLLDQNGNVIKHTMIDNLIKSDTFGIIYYDPKSIFKNVKTCFEHLDQIVDQKISFVENCDKCFNEYANRICYDHNQSLAFCKLCKLKAKENLNIAQNEFNSIDDFISKVLKVHNKRYWDN